jgi:hypothetical protein
MKSMRGQSGHWTGARMAAALLAQGVGLFAGCAAAPQHAVEAPPALREVQLARWLSGPDGMHVELVDFAGDASLVRVLGLQSELTGKVLAYQRVQNGERLEYRTKWHGGDLYAVVKERDGRWRAYIPGAPNAYDLEYVEVKSAAIDTTTIQPSRSGPRRVERARRTAVRKSCSLERRVGGRER